MDVIFVTGTAGAGKSLLTQALKNWYVGKGEDAIAVNLDPGVVTLPYEPEVTYGRASTFRKSWTATSWGRMVPWCWQPT